MRCRNFRHFLGEYHYLRRSCCHCFSEKGSNTRTTYVPKF